MWALSELLQTAAELCGTDPPKLHHVFSVEREPGKQEFIRDHHKPSMLFENAKDLCDRQAFDIISQSWKDIEGCDWLTLGFECPHAELQLCFLSWHW